MSNKNPRINVTFEETTSKLLIDLAEKENRSVASIVRELTIEALELREDLFLSKLAEKLDQKDVKKYSHEEAWE